MLDKKSNLKKIQEEAQYAVNKTNEKIDELGQCTKSLYTELCDIQEAFDLIRNVPNEKRIQYEELKQIRLNWKRQVEKIEKDYNENTIKNAGAGVAGAGVGAAVLAMGPTVAMGIATSFGVASTGTAISTLSGAAATNAALAWLGGGALTVGGGGIAAGHALLALAGPVGITIAVLSLITSGVFVYKNLYERKQLENVFTLIGKRDITYHELAIVELNERISRIKNESQLLHDANKDVRYFGIDYNKMTESQQYNLGTYFNLMMSSTQLLIAPILGLIPNYTRSDYDKFVENESSEIMRPYFKFTNLIITLANFLYKIELSEKDKKLLWKQFKKNKKMLEAFEISKKEFTLEVMDIIQRALNIKYLENKEIV